MDWVYLGHAMWLVRIGQLRLLFDPLVSGRHHGGVFEVTPPRTLNSEALRADFILISHRHPDHFDVASLAALAKHDADSVVVSPDTLVLRAARQLGFRQVRQLDSWQRVDLDGATLLSTPSIAPDVEWGMLISSDEGCAWNQVDSVHRNADAIVDTLQRAAQGLSRPELTSRMALALARWQPMLEVQALLGEATRFPLADYADGLAQIAALNAHTVVPGAAGARHCGAAAWLNDFVYPVNETRILRDIEARCADTRAAAAVIGHCYAVRGGATQLRGYDDEALVEVQPSIHHHGYRPLPGPAVIDPNLDGRSEDSLRGPIETWIEADLCPALANAYPNFNAGRPLLFSLQVVYPSGPDSYLMEVSDSGCVVTKRWSDDYDMLNIIAASWFADVLAGRRHWGEPLLGGLLRASHRAYRVDRDGVKELRIGTIFLYYALSYAQSNERWVDYQLQQHCQ